jgi:hypothetical protein
MPLESINGEESVAARKSVGYHGSSVEFRVSPAPMSSPWQQLSRLSDGSA